MSESIEQMQARLAAYDRQATESALNGALSSAIQAAGVSLKPGTEAQAVALLRGDVRTATLGDQSVLCGPGLKPLAEHVRERLNSAEFNHFVQPTAPADSLAGLPKVAAPTTAAGVNAIAAGLRTLMPDRMPGVGPVAKGGDLGSAIVASATQATGNPQIDMGMSFGLRRR